MIQIRNFKVKDVRTVVSMLSSIAGLAGKELRTLFTMAKSSETETPEQSQEKEEAFGVEIALLVLTKCYEYAEPKLIEWFADLCGVSVKDFEELDADAILEVIDQLSTREDAKRFFSKAYQTFRKIKGSPTLEESAGE